MSQAFANLSYTQETPIHRETHTENTPHRHTLDPRLASLKDILSSVDLPVIEKTDSTHSSEYPEYIGFKESNEHHAKRLGIYLHEDKKYICTWGITKTQREKEHLENWISIIEEECGDWDECWETTGKRGGYTSKMICIEDMKMYEIIGILSKLMYRNPHEASQI